MTLTQAPLPPDLCLAIDVDANVVARVRAAIDAATFVSAILRPPAGREVEVRHAKSAVELLQARDVAALIWGDARLARTVRADGVVLPWSPTLLDDYEQARDLLGKGAIVGVDCGGVRHDAMELAEAGADFIGFGLPTDTPDADAARSQQLELVAWWAEIFEVSCVALAIQSHDDARALAAAGADFLSIEIAGGVSPADIAESARTLGASSTIGGRG